MSMDTGTDTRHNVSKWKSSEFREQTEKQAISRRWSVLYHSHPCRQGGRQIWFSVGSMAPMVLCHSFTIFFFLFDVIVGPECRDVSWWELELSRAKSHPYLLVSLLGENVMILHFGSQSSVCNSGSIRRLCSGTRFIALSPVDTVC